MPNALQQVGKLLDLDGDNLADEGEPILYDFTVINTGNVRMSEIEVGASLRRNEAPRVFE